MKDKEEAMKNQSKVKLPAKYNPGLQEDAKKQMLKHYENLPEDEYKDFEEFMETLCQ